MPTISIKVKSESEAEKVKTLLSEMENVEQITEADMNADWERAAIQGLEKAYSVNEPEYSLEDVQKPNPDFEP